MQDVGAEKDAITSLKSPTHFGRPNWDRVFTSLAEKHQGSDVGVFFCGPTAISRALHTKCNQYSTPYGTRFFFGKGEFFSRHPNLVLCVWLVLEVHPGDRNRIFHMTPFSIDALPLRPDADAGLHMLTPFVTENF